MLLVAILGFALCGQSPSTSDGNRYFLMVFSHDDRGEGRVENSHTFATFLKSDKSRSILEQHTISWFPRSGQIRLLSPPESGVNRTLRETLEQARKRQLKVVMWGPFEITETLYRRAAARTRMLNSGQLCYQALANTTRSFGEATNCIHAVSDLLAPLATGTAHGEPATRMIVRHFAPHLVDPTQCHEWIARKVLPEGFLTGGAGSAYSSAQGVEVSY